MSDDYDEYEREAWLAELYEENAAQAREEFKAERLSSYYLANPNIAQPAFRTRAEARTLLNTSPGAALVCATTSAEVGLKAVLLRPLVSGLVYSEALANHVTNIVLGHQQLDRFGDLLVGLLEQFAGVNIKHYCRPGVSTPVWEELQRNQAVRNRVVHRGEKVARENAERAIALADNLLDVLVPAALDRLSLHLHDDHTICGKDHTSQEIIDSIERYLKQQEAQAKSASRLNGRDNG